MPYKGNINVGKAGMDRDSHPSNLEQTSYSFAMNANIEDSVGAGGTPMIQNEASNVKCFEMPYGYKVIGYKKDPNKGRTFLFLTNEETGLSEIGYIPTTKKLKETTDSNILDCGCESKILVDTPLEEQFYLPICEYKTIIKDSCSSNCSGEEYKGCLNFSIYHPIREENIQIKDEKCGQTLYWTDGHNPPRYLKLERLGEYKYKDESTSCGQNPINVCTGQEEEMCDDCSSVESVECIDCNRLRIFPLYNKPCLEPKAIQNGGRLKAGVYEFMVAYCDKQGNETSEYMSITNPITIFDATNRILGKEGTWARTNFGIQVEVNGLSRKYNYYKVAVLQRAAQDGVTSYYIEGVHPIDDNVINYYTEEDKQPITLNELMAVKPNYLRTDMMTSNNGYIFHAGLTVEKEMNLQPVMNLFGAFLKWQTVETTEDLYKDGISVSKYKSYLRDEVYPYSIRFITTDGFVTSNFILPNRPYLADIDGGDVNEASDDYKSLKSTLPKTVTESRTKHWQYYNTAQEGIPGVTNGILSSVEGIDVDILQKPIPYREGIFGYYESTEIYPDNEDLYNSQNLKINKTDIPSSYTTLFERYFKQGEQGNTYILNENANLCCKPVRHYRFPDFNVSPFMGDSNKRFGSAKIYPIGVSFDMEMLTSLLRVAVKNNLITQEQFERIDRVEIFRGDRTLNKSIIAKGLVYDMYKYNEEDKGTDNEVWYSNYPYNDLSSDKLNYADKERTTLIPHPYSAKKNGRFTFHSPDTSFRKPTLPTEMKVEAVQKGFSRGVFSDVKDHSKWVILTNKAYALASTLALTETLFEVMVRLGDFLVQESIAGDRVIEGGYWGGEWEGNLNIKASAKAVSTSGTNTVSLTGKKINIKEKRGKTAPNEVYTKGNIVAAGDSNLVSNNTNQKEKKLDKNVTKIDKVTRYFIVGSMVMQLVPEFGKKRAEWVHNFLNNGQPENFAKYYTSEGWYNNASKWLNPNNQIRGLTSKQYLDSSRKRVLEHTGASANEIKINNYLRESSVYLSTTGLKDAYTISYGNNLKNKDKSRFIFSEKVEGRAQNIKESNPHISAEYESNIASMYVSLRNYFPNQYGRVESIKWIPTGYCGRVSDSEVETIFGGDTFITRFSLKRKMPLFLVTAVGQPSRMPFNYYPYRNIGYTRFYVDHLTTDTAAIGDDIDSSSGGLGVIWNSIKTATKAFLGAYEMPGTRSWYNLDEVKSTNKDWLYVKPPNTMYLYYYGIPQFLVESEIDCNTRYGGVEPHDNFYPNVGDYTEWTQEVEVPIRYDNTYYYNGVFSKNTTMVTNRMLPTTFNQKLFDCLYDSPNGIAYSAPDVSEQDLTDPWLIYKPLDFYQFQSAYGKLVDVRGIESTQVLARFENQAVIFNAIDNLRDRIDNVTAPLGTGGIFSTRPVEFTKADIGYGGTQHKAMVSCEYGHFWVDSKRGHVFKLLPNGKGLEEITQGLRHWFKEHLPFKILKGEIRNLDETDLDMQFLGLGIALGWDSLHKRLFLTKKDKLLKSEYKGKLSYDKTTNRITNEEGEDILPTDSKYFDDVSFTVAYHADLKSWISYYSFKPDFYIGHHDYFQTGLNYSEDYEEIGVWSHLVHSNSYQVFYGKKYPFTIEVGYGATDINRMLSTVTYMVDSKRYHNNYDIAENRKIGFNKAWVYNHSQNSGQLNLIVAQVNNLRQRIQYPKYNIDSMDILATEENKKWTFNTIFNKVKDELNNTPIWLYDKNQIEYTLNNKAISYNQNWNERLRGDWFLLRLTQDKESRYKVIYKFASITEEVR